MKPSRLYFEKGDSYVCLLARAPKGFGSGNKLYDAGFERFMGRHEGKIIITKFPMGLVSLLGIGTSTLTLDAILDGAIRRLKLQELQEDPEYLKKHFRQLMPN